MNDYGLINTREQADRRDEADAIRHGQTTTRGPLRLSTDVSHERGLALDRIRIKVDAALAFFRAAREQGSIDYRKAAGQAVERFEAILKELPQ